MNYLVFIEKQDFCSVQNFHSNMTRSILQNMFVSWKKQDFCSVQNFHSYMTESILQNMFDP